MLSVWQAASQHDIEVLGLPGRHWKWRQYAGGMTLAQRISEKQTPRPDVLWVSDFVDLPSLWAFLPRTWGRIPSGIYFHENQLTYPRSEKDQHASDMAPGWSNLISLMAADGAAFNSAYHRESFGSAARSFLQSLPRPKPTEALGRALDASIVIHPGIDFEGIPLGPGAPKGAPLRIAFPHRWEHDKGPGAFARSILAAIEKGAHIEVVLLGEDPTGASDPLRAQLEGHTLHAARIPAQADYLEMLGTCDAVFSSADHEFYGIAMLEGCAVGCSPIAPNRLAYPETLPHLPPWLPRYENESQAVEQLVAASRNTDLLRSEPHRQAVRQAVRRHRRQSSLVQMDHWVNALAGTH